MEPLTHQDFQLLFEALTELERKDGTSFMLRAAMGTMLSTTKESAKEYLDKTSREFDQKKSERQAQTERVTLLRAKLIQLRDSMMADRELSLAEDSP